VPRTGLSRAVHGSPSHPRTGEEPEADPAADVPCEGGSVPNEDSPLHHPADGPPPRDKLGEDLEEAFDIVSPYQPRAQFVGFHRRRERWAVIVAHRRAGKTVACINDLIAGAAMCERPRPRFAYIAPFLNQAKDVAWDYLDEFTRFIPGRKTLKSELWVQLPGGARIRIYGADNPNRLRGTYFDGVILDEFGDMDPQVWTQVIRPALADREGWACFIGTPRGKNEFHRLWTESAGDRDWQRIELKASQTKLLPQKELAGARKYMSDDEYAQEFECSFEAAVRGAYYAKELLAIEEAGQITRVPHEPALPVHTAWDLGYADSTVIWFFQRCGKETRVIDVIKGEGRNLPWYVQQLDERPALHGHKGNWVWGQHWLPHDVQVPEIGTGKTRFETLGGLGLRVDCCPNLPVADGIQAVRNLLPNCWFDAERCKEGIEALRMYRREWNDKTKEFKGHPLHDWTSHYADAFRYFAVGFREMPAGHHRPIKRDTSWVI